MSEMAPDALERVPEMIDAPTIQCGFKPIIHLESDNVHNCHSRRKNIISRVFARRNFNIDLVLLGRYRFLDAYN